MTELYSMTRYLRNDLLENSGLHNFDDWASNFGEVISQLEMKPAGDGFRMKNRFSKFTNIPELMQMYKEFADIKTPDMIKLPVPEMKTGKPIIVTSKPDDMQKAYMKELAARSEKIHSGSVDPCIDNMLKVTHEARLLGLDSRCINRNSVPSPDSKVNKMIDNLEKIYNDTENNKGIQIVFCDIAINEDNEHFSVYNAVKQELVKRGMPENEICFAGDAKTDKARSEMFEKLRHGEKRIIIASTSKLGTGANIQDRVAAIHHLDIPWRPSDVEQFLRNISFLINRALYPAHKFVVNLNFLSFFTVYHLGFVNNDFFNEGVQDSGVKLGDKTVILDKINKSIHIFRSSLAVADFFFKFAYLIFKSYLLGFVLGRELFIVSLGNVSADLIFIKA